MSPPPSASRPQHGDRDLNAAEDRQNAIATVRTEVLDDASLLCAYTIQMVHITRQAG